MTDYWWGVATVLGLAYVGFGVYLAVDGVRLSSPLSCGTTDRSSREMRSYAEIGCPGLSLC